MIFGNTSSRDDKMYNFLDFWGAVLQNKIFVIDPVLIILSEIKKKCWNKN